MDAPMENPDDEKVSRAVRDALWRSEPIRALDMDSLRVRARDGIVVLQGIVASETHKFAAGQLARGVAGVKEVINSLTSDEELERRIAAAVASKEATRKHRITVNVIGGVAALYGTVPSAEDVEAIRRVALAVPEVVGVESRLQFQAMSDE